MRLSLMGIVWQLDWGESHRFTESGQEPHCEPVGNDRGPAAWLLRNDCEPNQVRVCKPVSSCLQAASATRGRIGQVSDLERRDSQTRRAPNACFPMAGAPWVTAGSQAGRKSRRTVDNHSRTLCEEKLESS